MPYILTYLLLLPIVIIGDILGGRMKEHDRTFHAKALDILENELLLGVLGIVSGLVFLLVNYVSWFIYLEAAGIF